MSRSSSVMASPSREEQKRKSDLETGAISPALQELYHKLKEAEENFSEMDLRDTFIMIGEYFLEAGEFERSLSNFQLAYDKAGATDIKIDITLKMMLVGFKVKDHERLRKHVEEVTALLEEGGDWERKNRFKAYEAVYLMMVRNFKQAAFNLLEILATFTSTELLPFDDFIKYTVLMSLASLDRASIRSKVVHAPEVLSAVKNIPAVHQFLDSLFKCKYREFFRAFLQVYELMKTDEFLGPHIRHWSREMRVVGYSQFLESYRSVTLDSMAQSFGVSLDFMDRELSEFISLGRLACKIDKVHGVIESSQPDVRSAIYSSILKTGDVMLNRLQKLARVMDV